MRLSFFISVPKLKPISFIWAGLSAISLIKLPYLGSVPKSPYKDIRHFPTNLFKLIFAPYISPEPFKAETSPINPSVKSFLVFTSITVFFLPSDTPVICSLSDCCSYTFTSFKASTGILFKATLLSAKNSFPFNKIWVISFPWKFILPDFSSNSNPGSCLTKSCRTAPSDVLKAPVLYTNVSPDIFIFCSSAFITVSSNTILEGFIIRAPP